MPLKVLAAAACASAFALGASATAGTVPRLSVLDAPPRVVVRGTSFEPGEHLLVRLVGRGVMSKRVVASRLGSFRVSLRRPPALACGRLLLQVRRPHAKTVTLRVGPPECAPPGAGGG